MKKILYIAMLLIAFSSVASCTKPMVDARVISKIHYYTDNYAAQPNDIYYAVRWSMEEHGYPVAEENLTEGFISSSWLPVTSDSHYIPLFGRKDYGVTSSYYRLKMQVVPEDGRTRIRIGTEIKSLVSNLESSGIEEEKVLASIGDYIRKNSPDISNLGINE